jgi:hypothetical protein
LIEGSPTPVEARCSALAGLQPSAVGLEGTPPGGVVPGVSVAEEDLDAERFDRGCEPGVELPFLEANRAAPNYRRTEYLLPIDAIDLGRLGAFLE